MKMSTKARYGLYAATELAKAYGGNVLSAADMSQAIGVTDKYLEQILALMKNEGIISAQRGAYGGYALSAPPEQISVGRVLRCLENDLKIVDCIGHTCKGKKSCAPHVLWTRLYKNINEFLDSVSLKELLEGADASIS